MALLRKTSPATAAQPFTNRLRAWWRGDIRIFPDAAREGEHPASTPWGNAHVPTRNPGNWDSARLKAAQLIWGHSLLGPCSPDELASLAAWLHPQRNTRIALLGAGLGGFGLALSRVCHCKVVGFEQSEDLLELSPDRRQGHLRSLDSITVRTEHSFDHVVIDGLGHRAGDILELIKPAASLVSLRGSIVLRSYHVASDTIRESAAFRSWTAAEPVTPHIPTQSELLNRISHAGFDVLDCVETADIHVAAVDACWGAGVDLVRLLSSKPGQRALVPALVQEVELWHSRLELVRSGDLKVIELLARRPATD